MRGEDGIGFIIKKSLAGCFCSIEAADFDLGSEGARVLNHRVTTIVVSRALHLSFPGIVFCQSLCRILECQCA